MPKEHTDKARTAKCPWWGKELSEDHENFLLRHLFKRSIRSNTREKDLHPVLACRHGIWGKQYSSMLFECSSCPALCDSLDCSLPGSSVHGLFQARIPEWIPSPRDLPDPGIEAVSPALVGGFCTTKSVNWHIFRFTCAFEWIWLLACIASYNITFSNIIL